MAYDQLLCSSGLYSYRSVAYVKTPDYWQDEPGRQSMQLNFQKSNDGSLTIERIAIVSDSFWPTGEYFPVEPILSWFDEQYRRGIAIRLVRLSALSDESDLVCDIGIYGNRAVGRQEIDETGKTVRFTLSFDFAEVVAAEKCWERLSVYAMDYAHLIQRESV